MAWRKTLARRGKGGRPGKGEKSAAVADSAKEPGVAERAARSRTEQFYKLARLSASRHAVRTPHDRVGTWRRLVGRSVIPNRSPELGERLAAREAERAQQEKIDATILAGQGGLCAACGEAPRRPYRDGDREKVLCRPCYFLIEEARERYETPELAAKWLTAAAQYLTRTEGGE
jgi:hypothetical protein